MLNKYNVFYWRRSIKGVSLDFCNVRPDLSLQKRRGVKRPNVTSHVEDGIVSSIFDVTSGRLT